MKPGDRFRHYKGGVCEIVTEGVLEETLEPAVAYKDENGKIWIRTLSNFTGYLPRFEKLGPAEPPERRRK